MGNGCASSGPRGRAVDSLPCLRGRLPHPQQVVPACEGHEPCATRRCVCACVASCWPAVERRASHDSNGLGLQKCRTQRHQFPTRWEATPSGSARLRRWLRQWAPKKRGIPGQTMVHGKAEKERKASASSKLYAGRSPLSEPHRWPVTAPWGGGAHWPGTTRIQ